MKKLLKGLVPPFLVYLKTAVPNFWYDLKRYYLHSATTGYTTESRLRARIVKLYHSVEKGLTMPGFRAGFGQPLLHTLMDLNEQYIRRFGTTDPQIRHSVGVVYEYLTTHEQQGFALDEALKQKIRAQVQHFESLEPCEQRTVTREEYFSQSDSPYPEFARSRVSVRNYAEAEVPMEKMKEAVDIARSTPSACNRQTARAAILTNKEEIRKILEAQGGNRGFGHLTDKLIIVTAELSVYAELSERYQGYIDGGMFAMNLLHALHTKQIAACIMNCSHTMKKDLLMRRLTGIPESEVFIAMIACGIPPEEFKLALSKRNNLEQYLTVR